MHEAGRVERMPGRRGELMVSHLLEFGIDAAEQDCSAAASPCPRLVSMRLRRSYHSSSVSPGFRV
jgi:hypothetical protein